MTLNQAVGGLIVALVLVYLGIFFFLDVDSVNRNFLFLTKILDSVTRSFAGSFSFMLCTLFSVLFLDFTIHSPFIIGAIIIIVATYAYSVPDDLPLCSMLRGLHQSKSEV